MNAIILLAIPLYVLAAGAQYLRLRGEREHPPHLTAGLGLVALCVHVLVVNRQLLPDAGGLDISLFPAASVLALASVTATWIGNLFRPLDTLLLILYPTTALILIATTLQPDTRPTILALDASLALHIFLSLAAFTVLTLGFCQALALWFQERHIRRRSSLATIRTLPPLATMEKLLSSFLWLGLSLLSISIVTGFVVLEDMFDQRVAHHSILSLSAWAVFATLLYGRHIHGWRGKIAALWTIAGAFLLVLAYFGSKLVIEILLQEG